MRKRWKTPSETETGIDTHGSAERARRTTSQIAFRRRVIHARLVTGFFSRVHANPLSSSCPLRSSASLSSTPFARVGPPRHRGTDVEQRTRVPGTDRRKKRTHSSLSTRSLEDAGVKDDANTNRAPIRETSFLFFEFDRSRIAQDSR